MRLIDADKLVNSLENNLQSFEEMISEHGKGIAHGTRIALGLVKEQLTISPKNPQPQWIPFLWRETKEDDGYDPKEFPLMACGELPENDQEILVTNRYHVWLDTFLNDDGIYLDSGSDLVGDVTAWMPLPEPYKPEKIEDNDD